MEKNILITGATSGIGLESALKLAQQNATVFISGRNIPKGQEVVAHLRRKAGHARIHFLAADLLTVAGVKHLAQQLTQQVDHLDVLINNAGGLFGTRRLTPDGFEASWFMNNLGPLLLTSELRPWLRKAGTARVVNLTTTGHRFAKIDMRNLQGEHHYVPMSNYGNAKLANLMAMYHWAPDLHADGISFFAADPGGATTDMTAQMEPSFLPWFLRPLWPLMRASFGQKNPEESRQLAARSTVFAATAPELKGKTALYLNPDARLGRASRRARDIAGQAQVWDISQQMLAPFLSPVASSPSLLTGKS